MISMSLRAPRIKVLRPAGALPTRRAGTTQSNEIYRSPGVNGLHYKGSAGILVTIHKVITYYDK